MVDDGMNETDVRAEVADPLLHSLGYKRNTDNDIQRGRPLKYNYNFLGHKKPTDKPLKGIPDYVLSVNGVGRWVLETKAPNDPINLEAIDQAISYARHPEVSATFVVLIDGTTLMVFQNTQRPTDEPLLTLKIESPEQLFKALGSTLSPDGIRRHCKRISIDPKEPVGRGLLSTATIVKGQATYSAVEWNCSHPLPEDAKNNVIKAAKIMEGLIIPVVGGRFFREGNDLKAVIHLSALQKELLKVMRTYGMDVWNLTSLANSISSEAEQPTLMEARRSIKIDKGSKLFDITQWKEIEATLDLYSAKYLQVVGYLQQRNKLVGELQMEIKSICPTLENWELSFNFSGQFEVELQD